MVGFQPRVVDVLSKQFEVKVTDLDPGCQASASKLADRSMATPQSELISRGMGMRSIFSPFF